MNSDGKVTVNFGDPATRSEKKYPDAIYISFMTTINIYSLYIKYKLKKSDAEKQADMVEKVKKFK